MKKNITEYRKRFKRWEQNPTQLTFENFVYVREPGEEIRQCKLTKKEEDNEYYKIRKDLPPYWWISERGYIISVAGDRPILYTGQSTEQGRLQAHFSVGKQTYIPPFETIYAVVFPDKCPYQSRAVKDRIKDVGIKALKRGSKKSIELHHEKGYIPAENKEEALRNLPENVKDIQLLLKKSHDFFKYINPIRKQLCEADPIKDGNIKPVQEFVAISSETGHYENPGITAVILDEKQDGGIIADDLKAEPEQVQELVNEINALPVKIIFQPKE